MGLLSWLRGTDWQTSESGNPTTVAGRLRLTVFPSDRGFKFCAAAANRDDDNPYFSDPYEFEDQAKDAAIAFANDRPSPHESLSDRWREQREVRAREHIDATETRLADLFAEAKAATSITGLRKVEGKAASTVRSMRLAADRAFREGMSDADVAKAGAFASHAEKLLAAVQAKIAMLKAR